MKTLFLIMLFLSNTSWAFNPEHIQKSALENDVPKSTIDTLLKYYSEHESKIENKNYVTFVDFRKPSSKDRMIVIQTDTGQVEKYLVAHGLNSGETIAEKFSNIQDSKMSSLGLYLIQEQYTGQHGASLFLEGLSPTNSKAKERSIVMHYADYVSDQWIANEGRIGRSWGCFALNKDDFLQHVIDKVKNGSLMMAFK